MTDKLTYEDGLIQGELKAIREILHTHEIRLDKADNRLRLVERIMYGVLGAIALIQLLPILQELLT